MSNIFARHPHKPIKRGLHTNRLHGRTPVEFLHTSSKHPSSFQPGTCAQIITERIIQTHTTLQTYLADNTQAILAQAIFLQTAHCFRVLPMVAVCILHPGTRGFHAAQGMEFDSSVRWLAPSIAGSATRGEVAQGMEAPA